MVYEVPHYINGKRCHSLSAQKLYLYDPATSKRIGEINTADSSLVNDALQAARCAFKTWSSVIPAQRAKILFRYKNLLDQNKENIAQCLTQEHGKTLAEALGSVQRGIDVVDFACGIPSHLKGSYAMEVGSGVDSYTLQQPLGVCAGITPFNFPAMIPLWMMTMAIACGNTFVLKPSEKDPSCSLLLVELWKEAGLPDGVVNVIQGDKETVNALITHPDLNAVSFVGSSAVAEYVYKTATAHGKRVQAFGGAKNHCVIMPDADLNQATEALVTSAYDCAGERCMAISVVMAVTDAVADALIEKLKPRIKHLKIGPGLSSHVEMGPLISLEHKEKIKSYIALGVEEGATLVLDGRSHPVTETVEGFFIGPSLFDHVTPAMRIYKEEIFGPVLCIVRVPDLATAIHYINAHDYGNGTAIFTRDGDTAHTFATTVQVGMVGINVPVPVPVAYHSFGGWKRSVFSDIGMYGPESIRFYTKLKTVTQRWLPGGEKWM
jgi:malonate-semialdehyde dehydrogenase (acetylating)/methylmalonate-semialdehyde dehydrogenase